MMIIMQFTFQIILLAVGFGVGYLLLIAANGQQNTMKTIGQTLGGILIVMAIILAIFSCYYAMKIANKGYMQGGCPVQKIMQQENESQRQNEDDEGLQNNSSQIVNPQENDNNNSSQNSEERPIKSNIKDHE